CATITSCPSPLSSRLTQGECVPVSSAIRLHGIRWNASRRAFAVVLSFRSPCSSPCSSSTQYQLERSPRSRPIVSFGWEKLLLSFAATVLTFFIAGLLLSVVLSSTSITWERTASRPETGLLIPSVIDNHDGCHTNAAQPRGIARLVEPPV